MAKIALIAPGCRGDQWGSTIEQDAEKIAALGFETTFLEDSVSKQYPFPGSDLANTPEQRARQIINFAQDLEVTAMWAVSGGESAPEVSKLLVEYGLNPAKYIEEHQVDPLSGQKLDYAIGAENGFPQDRPLPTIVGMSDVSSIQIALAKFGFPSLYANVAMLGSEFLTKAATSISDTKAMSQFNGLIQVSDGELPGKIAGPVYATVGGGLDSSLRTDWQPNFLPDTVLMVEDVSGYQTLTQRLREARSSGALENVQAIIIGNATSAGSKLSDGIPAEVKVLADEIGLPVFLVPDNQFGHLKDKEPTPIANFGIIEIDTSSKTAIVSGENSRDLARAYQQQNFEKSGKKEAVSEEAQVGAFAELKTAPKTLELFPLNLSAEEQRDLTILENVIGGPTKKLPGQLNSAGKTLLIVDGNWVSLGRELTDRYNKGDLDGVSSIVVGIDNPYPELKSRLDGAATEAEKVAVGLSFLTHPDFKFTAAEDGRYVCDVPFLDMEDVDLKTWAESSFIPWLKAHDIELKPEDILANGTKFSLPIDAAKNSEIIAKAENPEVVNQKVRHCEKRIEYFARRYMEFSDSEREVNQAGDAIDHEVPVFMVDRSSLPKEMKTGLFSAESLSVKVKTNEHQEKEEKTADKQSFVERLGLQKPDEKPRSFVEAMQAGAVANPPTKLI
jgi:muramoyltetrapeptide carboxypeptidase LdcA involved in peptidoglycan recycling